MSAVIKPIVLCLILRKPDVIITSILRQTTSTATPFRSNGMASFLRHMSVMTLPSGYLYELIILSLITQIKGGDKVLHIKSPLPDFRQSVPSFDGMMMLTLFVAVVSLAASALGHGMMHDPPSRQSAWRHGFDTPINFEDNELFCGGFQVRAGSATGGNQCCSFYVPVDT